MTVRLAQTSIDWINENVPRSKSVSAFAREAIEEKIQKETRARR